MDTPALIGASIRVKGEITSQEPLTIAGHVDGSVTVEGHALTIVAGGQATANLTADTIVVAGAVHGRLNAGARIIVRETAAIDGDLAAPSVSLADGATVCGRIETAERKAKLALAS
jgi:cytoskeletal protein CcmA (bactofilin family)